MIVIWSSGMRGDFFANQTDARFILDALRDQLRKLFAIDCERGAGGNARFRRHSHDQRTALAQFLL